jgi:hypothetical protein
MFPNMGPNPSIRLQCKIDPIIINNNSLPTLYNVLSNSFHFEKINKQPQRISYHPTKTKLKKNIHVGNRLSKSELVTLVHVDLWGSYCCGWLCCMFLAIPILAYFVNFVLYHQMCL